MRIPAPALLLASLLPLASCSPGPPDPPSPDLTRAVLEAPIPEALERGEAAFEMHCSACHGTRALGTDRGPALIHIVYEPAHHGDLSFVLAVERGVRAHHWGFGDMPPVPGLARPLVEEIVAYVRYLQRQAGIH